MPLSSQLNETGYGYKMSKTSTPISNLFYMDDLKLYAKDDEQLEEEI